MCNLWLSIVKRVPHHVPISDHAFALHKGVFHDAMCLRYNWQPLNLPNHCVCGSSFTTDHALTCLTGGFPSVRHNDLRDFTANLLTEVCPNVCIEPPLQALTGELLSHETSKSEGGACLDVSAQGFWGDRHQLAFFDACVFHLNASSYQNRQLPSAYRLHERLKQRSYDQHMVGTSRTWLLHTTSIFHIRRNGEVCFCNIQETCLSSINQARAKLCCSYCLDKMLP